MFDNMFQDVYEDVLTKEIRFRISEREYELLEKYAELKKLDHGADQVIGDYIVELLAKEFGYSAYEDAGGLIGDVARQAHALVDEKKFLSPTIAKSIQ